MKKLFLRDGKLWYNEFPKEPPGTFVSYPKSHEEYYDAVRSAKETAVEIINPEIMNGLLYLETASEGMMGDIPHRWTVEIEEHRRYRLPHEWSQWFDLEPVWAEGLVFESRNIARLIPLKEQSSGIAAVGVAEYGDLKNT